MTGKHVLIDPRRPRVRLADLIELGMLRAGETLYLTYKGGEHTALVREDGAVELPDGRVFPGLNRAAEAVKGVRADAGWGSWCVERDGERVLLFDIRRAVFDQLDGRRPHLAPIDQERAANTSAAYGVSQRYYERSPGKREPEVSL